MAERADVNREVVGSTPTEAAIFFTLPCGVIGNTPLFERGISGSRPDGAANLFNLNDGNQKNV